MGFKFSLATLLRLREIAEEREERLLSQILTQIVETRKTLVDLESRRQQIFRQREDMLRQQIAAAELLAFHGQVQLVEGLQAKGKEQLDSLEALRLRQLGIYETAHRDRDLLDQIKDEQVQRFRREQLLLEQNVMDDNFSSRRLRN